MKLIHDITRLVVFYCPACLNHWLEEHAPLTSPDQCPACDYKAGMADAKINGLAWELFYRRLRRWNDQQQRLRSLVWLWGHRRLSQHPSWTVVGPHGHVDRSLVDQRAGVLS